MASKSLNTALNWLLDRHLECIICKERYSKPKALNCMHSFCQKCLLDYYKDAKTMPCPVCKKPTQLPEKGVRGLKGNFYINSLLADFSTLNIVDSSSEKLSEDGVKCGKHRDCIKLFYCVPCKKLICRECAVTDHPETKGHRNIDYENAALEFKKSLQVVFSDRKKDIEACECSLKESFKARGHFHERAAMALSAVHAKAVEVTAQVKKEEERMINDIETLERDRNATFDKHEETVTKMLQEKQYTLEVAEDIVKNCSDSTFLDMYADLTSLSSGQTVPQIDRCLSRLTFEQSTRSVDLGTLDKEGTRELCREGKWKLWNQFGTFDNATAVAPMPPSHLAVVQHSRINMDNPKVLIINDTTGETVSTLSLEKGAEDIVEVQDQFVVADGTKLVSVYNKNDNFEFDFYTMYHPKYRGQRYYGWKGNNEVYVKLSSLAVMKKGIIIVGDVERKAITQHLLYDGSLLRTIFVDINPQFLAIDSKDRVVISDCDKQVDIIDHSGDTLITIKPTIDGENFCTGVCCDSSGIYIVATMKRGDQGHIHHYDTEGRFLNCIVKDLMYPRGISFTSDGQRLAVADSDFVKIYHKV